tara:strand:+ start:611 stop:916 length:306 start_codon:yes stop_codon:yes gene_type:complete
MNKWQEYQDRYKTAWDKQNIKDRALNSKLRAPQVNHHNRETHAENGRKGGAPILKLSKEAETINRMLNKKLSPKAISDILGKQMYETTNIIKRYRLPREEN